MKKIFILLLSFSVMSCLWAQESPKRAVVQVDGQYFTEAKQSDVLEIPLTNITPFLAFSITWEGSAEEVEVRFSKDGEQWSEWRHLHRDPHSDLEAKRKVSTLEFTSAEEQYFQLKVVQGAFDKVDCHLYSPGDTPAGKEETTTVEAFDQEKSACACDQPDYEDRQDWCPSGNCPVDATPAFTTPKHLIVHHSAGANTSSDWAAVVRSIWDFHVNSNGWDDVGYNWLIDPNGVIYQGRGDGVLGAHFCGTNGGTMGVCVLGNFQLIEPTVTALSSLKELLAWKACDQDIDPQGLGLHVSSGKVLDRISGHRDGCSTLCPGDMLYPMLPDVRQNVADYILNECEDLSSAVDEFFNEQTVQLFPNPAQEAVQVAISNDFYGPIRFQLTDLAGKELSGSLLLDKSLQQQRFTVPLESLSSGMYLLRMTYSQGSALFRVVKE